MHQRDIRRLVDSLQSDIVACDLQIFSMSHQQNCALLKTAPVQRDATLTAQFVLPAETCLLFEISSAAGHCGWLFMLPAAGDAFATSSGVIYTRPGLSKLKADYAKRVKKLEGGVKSLTPEIYLPHSDFSIYGIDHGSLLFISRNSTHVVTQ